MASINANLFNYKPDNVVVRNKTSYTVPANYNSLISFFISAESYAFTSASTNYGFSRASVGVATINKSFEVWLKAGDVITATISNSGSGLAIGTGPITINITINGTQFKSYRVTCKGTRDGAKDGTRPVADSVTQSADWGLVAHEYLNPT